MRATKAAAWAAACIGLVAVAGCGGDEDGGGGGGQAVRIGAVYPLSGDVASAGLDTLHGVELAAEIVNGAHPNIDLPFAKEQGLPRLDDSKIKLVKADTQGTPEKGASEVDRLATSERVAAVVGAYQSAVTLTASQRAERLQIPFVNEASSAVGLTERGLEWFFRTGPTDETFGRTFFEFLEKQKASGQSTQRVAIFHTNDEYGTDGAEITSELAQQAGRQVVADVKYEPTTTDLSSQVQRLRAARPDAVFVLSYTNDAILLIKTMRQLGYQPPAVLAYGAGFADPAFLKGVGGRADGVMTRASWSLELAGKRPATQKVAELFERTYGQPMTENSARGFQAMLTLAMAIDRAGSTDPAKIRDALRALDLTSDQTIMPWAGVKFDDKGQNVETNGVVEQLVGDEYRVVFPAEVASRAAAWPMSDL